MNEKTFRAITELHEWENNPRSVTKEGMDRLKKQIEKLGQYKPLLVTKDGTVLGGNMRLKAYRELGIKDVWVTEVEAETEEKKIEYALSDNDRVGKYDSDMIANMTGNFPEIDWSLFSVDLDNPVIVQDFIDQYNYDPAKEWKEMPEFQQEGIDFHKELIVRFLTAEDYDKFKKLIPEQTLTDKTKSIWYPAHDFDSQGRNSTFTREKDES